MKYKLKPEELLNYLNNKNFKEKKARNDLNNKNNNLLKDISLPKTLKNLNFESFQQNYFSNNTNNKLYSNNLKEKDNKGKENGNNEESTVLTIKNINYNNHFFELFKKKNKINLDTIKKCLNIKKKKFNKGNDFSSFFLQAKSDYYINVLNQGIINSFFSFYSNAEKFYINDNNNNYNEMILNNISFKIYNIKYPIFIMKELNKNNAVISFYESKNIKKRNIYEKCCDILGLSNDNSKNNYNEKNKNNYFMKGLNHDIKYDLENYLSDKIKLLYINNNKEDLLLYENTNFINKYQFQFIKLSNNKKIPIDKQNVIIEKNLKYSFNKPRIMYPLFLNSLFDTTNIFKHCFYFKNENVKNNSKYLNLFFQKNINRVQDIDNTKFGKNFQISEESLNILSGMYLTNPYQVSINNKQLKSNIIWKPIKLNDKAYGIFGQKNINKCIQKRRYIDMINNNINIKNQKNEIKLIIINRKNIEKLLNNNKEYIMMDNINEGFDFLFDFNTCGKMLYASEFMDEFQYNGYNNIIDLINKNYLYYSKFILFIIDDEQLNKKEGYSANKIVNNINQIISNKFSFIMNNNNYQINITVKVISNPHLINYEINNLYNELVLNNFNNTSSVYNENIYYRIINDIKKVKNDNYNINSNDKKGNLNIYETYILNVVQDEKLKLEVENIINIKYSKRKIM